LENSNNKSLPNEIGLTIGFLYKREINVVAMYELSKIPPCKHLLFVQKQCMIGKAIAVLIMYIDAPLNAHLQLSQYLYYSALMI
jgi:hypothetical protein